MIRYNRPDLPEGCLVPTGHGFYTPLRYPGGKGKLANFVARTIELNGMIGGTYVEPYAGGCAVAMELLLRGIVRKIHINDLNSSVHAFWHAVLNDTDSLIRKIRSTPVSMESWHRAKETQSDPNADRLDLAFSTFFLNRTNRSGILTAGVIGGKNQDGPWKLDARYNIEDLVHRIEDIASFAPKIALHNEDAEKLIRRSARSYGKNTLIYLDPPYFVKGKGLYMNHYQPEDHSDVARTVANLPKGLKWMVSYDNHEATRSLYRKYRSLEYTLSYSAAHRMHGSEVIFFSPGLIIPAPERPMRLVVPPAVA